MIWVEIFGVERDCTLWEKLGERHSLAESPENNESPSQMPCHSSLMEHCHEPCAGWGRAVVKSLALYMILTKLWPWASNITFPSLGVHLCKMKKWASYCIMGFLMSFELVKRLAQFLAHSTCALNVSYLNIIFVLVIVLAIVLQLLWNVAGLILHKWNLQLLQQTRAYHPDEPSRR